MKYSTFNSEEGESRSDSDLLPPGLFKDGQSHGLSTWSASVFITSLMAGMGVLALPHAMAGTGWIGLGIIFLASINSCYSAIILGRCWVILENQWEEYRGKFRYPYPAIGLRAVGPWMRFVVTGALHMTLLGIATVYLLLCAQIFQSLTQHLFVLSYRYWIVILAAVLCPLTWFGSMEEFWPAAFGALLTAAVACGTLFVSFLVSDFPKDTIPRGDPDFGSFSLAFGTILFGFGGVFFFPTIQNDMKDRQQFPKAAIIGFSGLLLLYLPVAIGGYVILGQNVDPNVLFSVPQGSLRTTIEISLSLHVFLAFILVINPVAQEIEEVCNVQQSFNWKRCILRTVILIMILIIAYSIPHFDKILNLVGGSTITLLTFILPPLFYARLQKHSKSEWEEKRMPTWETLFLIQIVVIGIAGGIACTYFAVLDIFNILRNKETSFVVP